MEGHCSTGQSPQWAVAPIEEEEEEEEEEGEEEEEKKKKKKKKKEEEDEEEEVARLWIGLIWFRIGR